MLKRFIAFYLGMLIIFLTLIFMRSNNNFYNAKMQEKKYIKSLVTKIPRTKRPKTRVLKETLLKDTDIFIDNDTGINETGLNETGLIENLTYVRDMDLTVTYA